MRQTQIVRTFLHSTRKRKWAVLRAEAAIPISFVDAKITGAKFNVKARNHEALSLFCSASVPAQLLAHNFLPIE